MQVLPQGAHGQPRTAPQNVQEQGCEGNPATWGELGFPEKTTTKPGLGEGEPLVQRHPAGKAWSGLFSSLMSKGVLSVSYLSLPQQVQESALFLAKLEPG